MRASLFSHQVASQKQRGFVLVTSLVLLSLLSLMSLAMFYANRSATQTSAMAQNSTEAYYFAETAINYISWALANDAEFDSFAYSGAYIHAAFTEPPTPANAATVGDFSEWGGYMWHPGPILNNSDTGTGLTGQLKYFDNSRMSQRELCFEDATLFDNCIDVTLSPGDRVEPSMHQISVNLPRYIKLDISQSGVITPSIPQLPHQDPPVAGQDVPDNGAIVWITAGDPANAERDIEIFPLDPAGVYTTDGIITPAACTGVGIMPSACPCNFATINIATDVACNAHVTGDAYLVAGSGSWLSSYSIVAYAIAYVNGKPSHLIRAVIR